MLTTDFCGVDRRWSRFLNRKVNRCEDVDAWRIRFEDGTVLPVAFARECDAAAAIRALAKIGAEDGDSFDAMDREIIREAIAGAMQW